MLSQYDTNGNERPIYYASRTLNKAERNYSTIEKELLGVVYAIDNFKYYLYGKEFEVHKNHNPLTYLNNITLASSRLTRWRLKLSEYSFKIVYKKGILNSNADALSRIQPEDLLASKEDMIETLLSISIEQGKFQDRIKYVDGEILTSKEPNIAECAPRNLKTGHLITNDILIKYGGRSRMRKEKREIG